MKNRTLNIIPIPELKEAHLVTWEGEYVETLSWSEYETLVGIVPRPSSWNDHRHDERSLDYDFNRRGGC